MASTVKIIDIQFEATDSFPKNVMLTNISGSGYRGFFYFEGANQFYTLPTVVCDSFSANQYYGIKIDMIEDLEDRLVTSPNESQSLTSIQTKLNDLTSTGYDLVRAKISNESSYESSPGTFQTDYGNYTFNGTWTAADIIRQIGQVTKQFMNTISAQKGYTKVDEVIEFNLDRFFIDLTLDKLTHIGFKFDLTLCPDINDIFGFPISFETLTVVDETNNANGGSVLRVVFDRNLKANVYTKLDDRISRIIIGLENRVIALEGGYAGDSGPSLAEQDMEPIVESTTTYQNNVWEDVDVNPGHSYKLTMYGQVGDWGSPDNSRNPDC